MNYLVVGIRSNTHTQAQIYNYFVGDKYGTGEKVKNGGL